ncbi:hypothetical protein F2P81_023400 [Scophthalmus maximus]|uniref:DDE Tnp4 domain-containing protein n=1 Tax=Scophthalmus maximus TaxID=52904 RepID=A0A6A4RXE7_SCOMX|nr:hypothetical protein F2P81_023400 [Scophthalmus maximus]
MQQQSSRSKIQQLQGLSHAIQLPKKVAICKCSAHTDILSLSSHSSESDSFLMSPKRQRTEDAFQMSPKSWDSDIVVTTTAGLPPSTTTKSEEGSCEDQYPGSCGPCSQFHKISKQCHRKFQSNQRILKAVMRPGNIPTKCVHPLLQKSKAVVWLLMALFHTEDVKKYGFNAILEPLVHDLKVLECTGIELPFCVEPVHGTIAQHGQVTRYCVLNDQVPVLALYFDGQSYLRPDFHLSRPTVAQLIHLLHSPSDHGWGKGLEVLVFLFWLASTTSYRVVSQAFSIPCSTVHDIIHRVANKIIGLKNRVIYFSPLEELERISTGFKRLYGCNIRIKPPSCSVLFQ